MEARFRLTRNVVERDAICMVEGEESGLPLVHCEYSQTSGALAPRSNHIGAAIERLTAGRGARVTSRSGGSRGWKSDADRTCGSKGQELDAE